MISARLVDRIVHLHIDEKHHLLTEQDVRRLRAEINRVLQQIAEQRK